jgi:hypothetical protein
MKQLTYKITQGYSELPNSRVEVNGFFLFELFGYQWAAHQEFEDVLELIPEWVVDEVSTGFELCIPRASTLEEAKDKAWKYLLDKGEILTRFHVEKARMKIEQYEQVQK